jgi:hypothetical protein
MKNSKVISNLNLPTKLPLWATLTMIMALDFYNMPQWICGGVGVCLTIIWIVSIYRLFTDKHIDIFKDKS